jgi:hypothetical protein
MDGQMTALPLADRCEAMAVREEAILDAAELTMKSHRIGFDRQNAQEVVDLLRLCARRERAVEALVEAVKLMPEHSQQCLSERFVGSIKPGACICGGNILASALAALTEAGET